ncbi:MAG: hypothetical protein IPJ77_10930 [Planctomycetes bacterium]|nr:hypothetical protein [Planctomycetota bacterium]
MNAMRLAHLGLGLVLGLAAEPVLAQRYAGALQTRKREPAQSAAQAEAQAPAPRRVSRYAVLPLRNLSADVEGARELENGLCAALAERGARFVPDAALDAVLQRHRVRYTDSLSVADARAVRDATGASFALAGVVFEFVRGSTPRVALCVRVIDLASGERVQSSFVALRGEDSRGLLGLGAVEDAGELVERAIDRILADFGPNGGPLVRRFVVDAARARADNASVQDDVAPRAAAPKDAKPSAAAGAESANADAGSAVDANPSASPEVSDDPELAERAPIGRLALLPFVNRSTRADAGTSVAELLAHAWFQATGAQIVESSALRSALVRARIRSLTEIDTATLASIGAVLDARWFALGSVDRFGEEAVVRDQRYPEVEFTVRLVDGRTGLVAASKTLRLRGDDGETLLRLGVERNALALASDAARELVLALEGGS